MLTKIVFDIYDMLFIPDMQSAIQITVLVAMLIGAGIIIKRGSRNEQG